ncbi:ribonuclease HI family protein [Novosphingobium sp. M1R2S20]|uniref:Ribonuclease HI family protein n=1 Tax=Novosphingobium rhizovicinum TaxID=3228928 RepID=A0ABV3R7I8_9SPHN
MRRRAVYFFDGGSRPNPGPMEAAVVNRGVAHFRDSPRTGDNNEAEWGGLIFAVELAIAQGDTDVLFVGDSLLVIQQARGLWTCRSTHLRPWLAAFQHASAPLARIGFRHVPRSKNLAGIALARRYDP